MKIKENTLIITEKKSVANQVKSALGENNYTITNVSGHIKMLKFKKYANSSWLKTKFTDLLQDQLIYVPAPMAKSSFGNLNQIKDSNWDKIVLAMDPDEQGKVIRNHVYDYLKTYQSNTPFYQIQLEALSKKGIIDAFKDLKEIDPNTGLSGEFRAKIDLRYGAILSRLVSLAYFQKTKRWITYHTGRVQTPTLCLVKNRLDQIKNFIPISFKQVMLHNEDYFSYLNPTRYVEDFSISPEVSVKTKNRVDLIVTVKEGLNTDQLLILLSKEHSCFKKLGKFVTNLLSQMYLKGYISYPRTDNNQYNNYSNELEAFGTLYKKEFNIEPIVPSLEPTKKVTDHGPITPLINLNDSSDELEKKVLKTLFNHAKKIFSGSNYYWRQHFELDLNKKKHQFSILIVNQKNFSDGLASVVLNRELPPLIPFKTEILEKQTQAPAYFTPSSLLAEMGKEKIGTKSTRTTIIDSLIERKYLLLKENKLLVSNKGVLLWNFWVKKWKIITTSELTKDIESLFPIKNKEIFKKEEQKYLQKLALIL